MASFSAPTIPIAQQDKSKRSRTQRGGQTEHDSQAGLRTLPTCNQATSPPFSCNKGDADSSFSSAEKLNMCERCVDVAAIRAPIARRSILRLAAIAAAGFTPANALAAAAKAPPKPENILSPDAALDRLMKGNARYVGGVSKRHDFKHEREPLRTGQNPFAAVLSCADSRISPEFCFDTARGDVFVCRVAGNFASDDVIASLEYAVQVLNTPLIMVLGHDACGAINATAKSIKEGTALPGRLPALVAALSPAVKAVEGEPGDVLANAIRRNVMLNVEKLSTAAPILARFVDDKKVRVVGGLYRLDTGRVELLA